MAKSPAEIRAEQFLLSDKWREHDPSVPPVKQEGETFEVYQARQATYNANRRNLAELGYHQGADPSKKHHSITINTGKLSNDGGKTWVYADESIKDLDLEAVYHTINKASGGRARGNCFMVRDGATAGEHGQFQTLYVASDVMETTRTALRGQGIGESRTPPAAK